MGIIDRIAAGKRSRKLHREYGSALRDARETVRRLQIAYRDTLNDGLNQAHEIGELRTALAALTAPEHEQPHGRQP